MIWAIADLHFDPIGDKPMDIFGKNWIGHKEKIINDWNNKVKSNDLVLLPGDISWALKLDNVIVDLETIDNLPGKKMISKGNHDYWWGSISKMDSLGFNSISFINNNSFIYEDVEIFGSRGWSAKDTIGFNEDDEKIYQRELMRLRNSLETSIGDHKKIVMLHYPPFNLNLTPNEFANILVEYNVNKCIYGHLHAEGHKYVMEGNINGVEYQCVSSDYVDFKLQEVYL